MGKSIYWLALASVTVLGVWVMIYYGGQPRPVTKIPLGIYENPGVLAENLVQHLKNDVQKNPLIFLGVEADRPEHFTIWKEFLARLQEPGLRYDLVVMDQFLESSEFPNAHRIATKEGFNEFVQGVQAALSEGKRVAVLVPTIYAVQMIPENLAQNFMTDTQRSVFSLSLTDFPRSREQEKKLRYPCSVEGVDRTGLGPFGCLVLQAARGNYKTLFQQGQQIGMVQEIGLHDWIVLLSVEK